MLNESYELHVRCLARYTATLGPYHHRTGDGCVHVANHYIRHQKFEDALYARDDHRPRYMLHFLT
jgi:hypothetical protein